MQPHGYELFEHWAPQETGKGLVVPYNHGIATSSNLVELNDPKNANRSQLERVLLEYNTDGNKYPLYTFGQVLEHVMSEEEGFKQRLRGELAERVARRVMTRFLHKLKIGKQGGIYDARFKTSEKEGYIVASKENIVLKVHNFPNLVLIKMMGPKPFESIVTDLDGLFDHRTERQRHLIVVEAKEGGFKLKPAGILEMFDCMGTLYPDASFTYVLFTTSNRLFSAGRTLHRHHADLYNTLAKRDIASLFFTFNESREELKELRNHLYYNYVLAKQKSFLLASKGLITDDEISIYDTKGNVVKRLHKKENGDYADITEKS